MICVLTFSKQDFDNSLTKKQTILLQFNENLVKNTLAKSLVQPAILSVLPFHPTWFIRTKKICQSIPPGTLKVF